MAQIIEIISTYGVETIIIALMINLLTGIIKLPIKAFSRKLKDYTKVTRFIVFLPIILGFVLCFLYSKFIQKSFTFDKEFITLWVTSSSLSMTFYAIVEKIFPSQKNVLSDSDIKTNEMVLENIRLIADKLFSGGNDEKNAITQNGNENEDGVEEQLDKPIGLMKESRKIILKGNTNEEIKIEK